MQNTKTLMKWGVAFLFAITLYFIAPRGVSPEMPIYAALTGFAIVLWVFEVFPPFATATALCFGYILLMGTDPELVFAPWGTTLVWISFGGVLFGEAMKSTGLAKRIALKCLLITGGSFKGLAIGFAIAGVILGMLLPSIFARVVIFCAIGIGIIDTLKLDKFSRMSSTLILMAFFAAAAPCLMFLHTSESFIWAFEVMFGGRQNVPVSFWGYVQHGTLLSIFYVIASFGTLWLVKGKENLPPRDELRKAVDENYAEMGPMTGREKRLTVLVVLGISAFMLQPWTGINDVFMFAFIALMCYLPGLKIEKPENFNTLQLTFLLMITGCMAMGMVGNSIGASKWAVEQLKPILESMSPVAAVITSYLGGTAVNFILTPLAATAAFTPAFGEIGIQTGINPLPLFYAFSYGLDQYVLPYEMVPFLYIFTTGYIKLAHVVKALAIRFVLAGILIAGFAVPYWIFIGIL